ncbi:hypothetical protein V5F77_25735 [Xanthobacter sp. DSM 24535]|uniref:hypothetical protein n=1 Tax=Roseixanthobacter psychrophilus TaxID=3119917 RepID=UPI003726B260
MVEATPTAANEFHRLTDTFISRHKAAIGHRIHSFCATIEHFLFWKLPYVGIHAGCYGKPEVGLASRPPDRIDEVHHRLPSNEAIPVLDQFQIEASGVIGSQQHPFPNLISRKGGQARRKWPEITGTVAL